jgi:hypothetical protein
MLICRIIVQIANNSCELMIDKDYLAKKPLRRVERKE